MEQWRKVPGYENYEISIETKEGACRNIRTGKLIGNYCKRDKRIYWGLRKNGVTTYWQAARWIAITYPELVENEYFEGAEIDHKDTDRLNNHPSNLKWVTRKGNQNNPLTIIHLREANIGRKQSLEACKKISAARKNKHMTEKTKEKLSNSLKGIFKNRSDQSKPVFQYSLEGDYLNEFPSAMEAERITGVNQGNISKCCLGKQKYAGKKGGEKYIWKYE